MLGPILGFHTRGLIELPSVGHRWIQSGLSADTSTIIKHNDVSFNIEAHPSMRYNSPSPKSQACRLLLGTLLVYHRHRSIASLWNVGLASKLKDIASDLDRVGAVELSL